LEPVQEQPVENVAALEARHAELENTLNDAIAELNMLSQIEVAQEAEAFVEEEAVIELGEFSGAWNLDAAALRSKMAERIGQIYEQYRVQMIDDLKREL